MPLANTPRGSIGAGELLSTRTKTRTRDRTEDEHPENQRIGPSPRGTFDERICQPAECDEYARMAPVESTGPWAVGI